MAIENFEALATAELANLTEDQIQYYIEQGEEESYIRSEIKLCQDIIARVNGNE